jgi:hypothetical protein
MHNYGRYNLYSHKIGLLLRRRNRKKTRSVDTLLVWDSVQSFGRNSLQDLGVDNMIV